MREDDAGGDGDAGLRARGEVGEVEVGLLAEEGVVGAEEGADGFDGEEEVLVDFGDLGGSCHVEGWIFFHLKCGFSLLHGVMVHDGNPWALLVARFADERIYDCSISLSWTPYGLPKYLPREFF